MAKFRIDALEELSRQMEFTPQDARLAQISAAEDLLHSIDPLKAYPWDYIVHRITGYRPKRFSEDLLTGMALHHDLGLLIEQVSDTLNVRVDTLREPVLTIDDVTEKFNVTSKTIQRWRRKGLPARRFVFADGKRRVGFLLGSVEKFFAAHRDQVDRGTNFSQVDDSERDRILTMAHRLATMCRCCEREIARRIARKLNRSPLTIQHTIRRHDERNSSQAILPDVAPELSEDERSQIIRGYRRGLAVGHLARRVGRNRSTVYRVIVEERLAKLNRRKVKFIDDPLYHTEDAAQALDVLTGDGELSPQSRPEDARIPRDLPPYLQELYRTPLLTPSRERALFLKLNFCKFEFIAARRNVEPQFAKLRDIQALEALHRRTIDVKNQIVRANLRLVVSVARKHLRAGLSLMELVSEGNLTLMRAVESFDVHKGNRFSTYATLALMKGFARTVPEMLSARRAGISDDGVLSQVPDRRRIADSDRFIDREHVTRLLSHLNDRERHVMLAHYGLDGTDGATFEQVGARLGISRQQVRQIEQTAMLKLRHIAGVA